MVMPMTPRQVATHSGYIFAGTVLAIDSQRIGGTILTRVLFEDLRFGNGASQSDSIVLTLAGGTVGNDHVVIDGQPNFELESRYIVFASADLGSPGNSYMPVVGLHQGYFMVGQPRPTAVVYDALGLPVTAITPDRLTVAYPDSLMSAQQRELIEAWRRVVLSMGEKLAFFQAARIWFLASLGKYVPGKVWVIVLRVAILRGAASKSVVAELSEEPEMTASSPTNTTSGCPTGNWKTSTTIISCQSIWKPTGSSKTTLPKRWCPFFKSGFTPPERAARSKSATEIFARS
jgi:hypothetical protein